jgi:hypothetical protein
MPVPASPGTSEFRCEMCGRFFNTQGEIDEHQADCEQAYRSGRPNKEQEQPKAGEKGPDGEWVSTP